MITVRTFRAILLLKLASVLLFMVFAIFLRNTLPHDLLTYQYSTYLELRSSGIIFILTIVFSLIYRIFSLVVFIALYLLRPFARPLFIVLIILSLVSQLISPAIIILPKTAMGIGTISTILDGIILAIIYWSPISEKFNAHKPVP
jgi:hypothetical protein